MTPFGLKMRSLRYDHQVTLSEQADILGVSAAYISALEHGNKGRPSPAFVDQICVWLNLIWDEAEHLKFLAQMSHPKPKINVTKQNADATFLANLLAQNIDRLSATQCRGLSDKIQNYLRNEDSVSP